jgi:hypothetical protein
MTVHGDTNIGDFTRAFGKNSPLDSASQQGQRFDA